MKQKKKEAQPYNYLIPEHVLIFVYAGELRADCTTCKATAKRGECIFLHKDTPVKLEQKPIGDFPFKSVSFRFNQQFLFECYQKIDKNSFPSSMDNFNRKVIELTKNPYLESLYISMFPYVRENLKPIKGIIELKLMEAVTGLLIADERFYPCLFSNFSRNNYPDYKFNKTILSEPDRNEN